MATQSPSPLEFYNAFWEVASEQTGSLLDCWMNYQDFTSLMRSRMFPEIARRLGVCCYQRDYYTLDGIFYRERDDKNFPEYMTYAKFISVALEHENDAGRSQVEMNKLQLFNTPLKVLITYPTKRDPSEKLLAKYEEIVSGADIFNDMSTLRRQLVIFGSRKDERPIWEAFVYSQGKFVPVERQPSIQGKAAPSQ